MSRSIIVSGAFIALLIAGCSKAADDQQKAAVAQSEANDKIAAARAEADKKVASAQSEADMQVAAAQASFMTRREDYRHKTTLNLVDLDHKVDVLSAKSRAATGQAQVDMNASLKQIRIGRADFATDYLSLESTTAATWDATQARLDREWAALSALVDKA